jgi:catechol 2,3-dioxygenase-like lactoylglutathione lyase family enzyme
MIVGLDHIAIAVRDLDLAAPAFEALLGRRPDWREEAAGARHAWFQLSNMALDIVQPDGPGESGDRVRARLADGGDGLWGLAFAVDDAWRLSFVEPDVTHGVPIALAQRTAGSDPRGPVDADCVHALDHVVINTANPDRAVALYGARLGLDFRLDRSNPEWGSRLMFFRCGGAVVEIGASLKTPVSDAPDRLSGLAWRVADPHAAQARLAAAGFDVSEVRKGRKPGTHVFTVRKGVPGAPSLVISADPNAQED